MNKHDFYRIAPGDYETADGMYRLYRVVGVTPAAWNVEDAATGELLVDGAATMRDALAILERAPYSCERLAQEQKARRAV